MFKKTADLAEVGSPKYEAILKMPEDFTQQIGNGSLVIEMDVDMREDDEVNYVMNYKLNKEMERQNYNLWYSRNIVLKNQKCITDNIIHDIKAISEKILKFQQCCEV